MTGNWEGEETSFEFLNGWDPMEDGICISLQCPNIHEGICGKYSHIPDVSINVRLNHVCSVEINSWSVWYVLYCLDKRYVQLLDILTVYLIVHNQDEILNIDLWYVILQVMKWLYRKLLQSDQRESRRSYYWKTLWLDKLNMSEVIANVARRYCFYCKKKGSEWQLVCRKWNLVGTFW